MHELSVCMALIDQVTTLAGRHAGMMAGRVEVEIGVLSGIEPRLLVDAFGFAKVGTLAERAELITEVIEPRVRCSSCDAEMTASINRLGCPACGSLDTVLVRGDELTLLRIVLVAKDAAVEESIGTTQNV